jgi:hypothetical protein
MDDDHFKLMLLEHNKGERDASDAKYAAKLIEKIALGMLSAVGLGILAAVVNAVLPLLRLHS